MSNMQVASLARKKGDTGNSVSGRVQFLVEGKRVFTDVWYSHELKNARQ